ncbi:MAG: Serine/threonine protein kinase [candidate division Zixibacteria bacterium RBG-1]|nr:MAG: Serine/threonine protein kinase [candidate division Zixibacteria bacterium RBG-1]OGC85847.1 MAG: hypothetical protein A2V73_07775 [candidate division Zixibacteria bacterium RBG_19FT_COMBO_42_43]
MIGKTISHYKILEKLGEGGMGVVYKAQDTKLDRLVALKFLPEHLLYDPTSKARFIQEAKGASAINHPNITTVYEIDEAEGKSFIAMELIEGKSLKTLIEEKELPVNKIIDMAIQVCEGLHKAHQSGIVHRDIKPENILIGKDDLVKILDFGLAKLKGTSRLTQTGTTTGTVAYMSPEQAQGEEVDQRSDIFSLGVVLYEMITNRSPFEGKHSAAIIYSIINETPQPLARFDNTAPTKLQEIVDKVLAKDKGERYQHIDELLADLKRCRKESGQDATATKKDKKGVAVLYFENLSSDPESDYFSAGITEDILTDLSKIESIRVASRNAVLPYKGKAVDIPLLGKKLNVDAVLEGSVRKAGNRIRISAQLIDTKEGFHLWAERYDRELKEVFDLQEEIAKKIASALKIKLSEKEEEKIAQKYKGNLQAYDYYLKGRNYYSKYTKSDMLTAIQMFKNALEVDPNYALAYAGLADSYYQMVEKKLDDDKSLMNKAEQEARKALSIDPNCSEAYKALGTISGYLGRYNSGYKLLRKALEINPNYEPARTNLGIYLMTLGEFEKAEHELLLALEHDPTLLFPWIALSFLYLKSQKYSQVEACARKLIESEESSFYIVAGHFFLAKMHMYLQQYEKAFSQLQKALELQPKEPRWISCLAVIYAARGDLELALQTIDEMTLEEEPHFLVFEHLIQSYAILQKKEKMYEWIKKGISIHVSDWVFLEYDPLLHAMRKEPEFQRLLQEIKNKIMNSE